MNLRLLPNFLCTAEYSPFKALTFDLSRKNKNAVPTPPRTNFAARPFAWIFSLMDACIKENICGTPMKIVVFVFFMHSRISVDNKLLGYDIAPPKYRGNKSVLVNAYV